MKRFIIVLFFIGLSCFQCNRAEAIKIGLLQDVDKCYFGIATDGQIVDTSTSKQIIPINKLTTYELEGHRSCIELKTEDDDRYKIDCSNITIRTFDKSSYVCVKQKWYRGTVHVINNDGNLTVVNDLGIEDYVQGVTPAEMPSSWNYEALKAQAIAVRSYAIANIGKHGSKGYDLADNTQDQAYNGIACETERTNQAVQDTAGIVLTYDDHIISTMYSASAGGQTKSALESWGKDVPYLQSVKSFDDEVPANGHGVGMTQHGAKNLADMGYNAYQILAYFYSSIHFAKLNPETYK